VLATCGVLFAMESGFLAKDGNKLFSIAIRSDKMETKNHRCILNCSKKFAETKRYCRVMQRVRIRDTCRLLIVIFEKPNKLCGRQKAQVEHNKSCMLASLESSRPKGY
jgi:hypothetical protein